MEAKLFAKVYQLVFALAHPRGKGHRFCDQWIVLIYLWSVLHDRSVVWACDARNWPDALDASLPADSTMSRRLRTVSVLQLIDRAMAVAGDPFGPAGLVKTLDSKPLLVGAYSKDRDARRGRTGAGMMARGYRLHSLNHGRIVRAWTLDTMNAHDSISGATLLGRGLDGGGYVVADNAYDANDLHARWHDGPTTSSSRRRSSASGTCATAATTTFTACVRWTCWPARWSSPGNAGGSGRRSTTSVRRSSPATAN